MTSPPPAQSSRRETRLLLATIAVSIGVLLLLARFRFPEAIEHRPADPAPAPLERLAARAAYDELASTMADLERRIEPRVAILRVQPDRASGGYVVAPRLTADRAVALLEANETLAATDAVPATLITRDVARELIIIGVPAAEDAVVTLRSSGTPRPDPRYVVIVEATAQGLTLRPVYVGRTGVTQEPRTATPLIVLSGLQNPVSRGAAVFSLDGNFIGLVTQAGSTTQVIAGDFLQTTAQAAQASDRPIGDLGLDVQPLSPALARATGAEHGVLVSYVHASGASDGALRPGDVIQFVDDTAITTVAGFRQVELTRMPDTDVKLAIVRERTVEEVTVKARSAIAAPVPPSAEDHGIVGSVAPGAGVEVIAVRSGSPAAAAGIQRGDLVVLAGSQQAPDTAALTKAYRAMKPGDAMLIGVYRGQQHVVVALEKR